MPTLPITERGGRIAPAEYLAAERRAATHSEYVNGKAYAMAGASREHVTIVANLAYLLVGQFKGRPCMAFTNDMRLKVTETGLYTYPDVAALCSEPEFEDAEQDTLTNPSLIIEVLSDSTERYDRGNKFAHYRRLTSLHDYVLVSQHRPLVEHFTRHGEEWILRMGEGLEASLPLPAMGCELPLADIYDKVSFGRDDFMTDARTTDPKRI
jgi:Uma2 family endonuclease